MNTNAATEYRNLPLSILTESKTNPRRIFEDDALRELADSIRSWEVLSPLLVRPLNECSFEIVAGARRYRAAELAEAATARSVVEKKQGRLTEDVGSKCANSLNGASQTQLVRRRRNSLVNLCGIHVSSICFISL